MFPEPVIAGYASEAEAIYPVKSTIERLNAAHGREPALAGASVAIRGVGRKDSVPKGRRAIPSPTEDGDADVAGIASSEDDPAEPEGQIVSTQMANRRTSRVPPWPAAGLLTIGEITSLDVVRRGSASLVIPSWGRRRPGRSAGHAAGRPPDNASWRACIHRLRPHRSQARSGR